MKKRLSVVLAVLVVGVGVLYHLGGVGLPVDSSFATSATMKYHYDHKNIDAEISDADLGELKKILRGYSGRDTSSCFYTDDASITLTNGRKTIVFYPALCCPLVRINETSQCIRITEDEKKKMDKILSKYGWLSE